MIVAGGTYLEQTSIGGDGPSLGGSALRAALAIPSAQQLVTAVDDDLLPLMSGTAATFSLRVENVGRDKAVGFAYLASFAEPTIRGVAAALAGPMAVSGEEVLAFGMVESGERKYDAGTLIYDPQSTSDSIEETLNRSSFNRAAICANALEIRSLAPGDSLEKSARALLKDLKVDVVVVKAGARGCLVVEENASEWIGAVPSASVRKIGSGDIFSACFAHAWTTGSTAVEAARIASHATSWWVSHRLERIPEGVLNSSYRVSSGSSELDNKGRSPRIYLAGPFFSVAEVWLVDSCRRFLEQAGADVFSPLHDIGLGGDEVAAADLRGLEESDAVFAILDGWDPGTLFEAGWANRKGIPIVGAAARLDSIRTTMLSGTGAELYEDFTTAMYRSIWRGLGAEGVQA